MECLCSLICLPYNGDSLFPCFRNCADFCFPRNLKKSLTLGYLCFPTIFCTMEAHFFHVTDIVWMQNYKIFLSFLELFKVIFSIHRDMRG